MKKLILFTLLIVSLGINAQAYVRTATKVRADIGDGWGNWQPCSIKVNFDFDNNLIDIYTEEPQYLSIEDYNDPITKGGVISQSMYVNDSQLLHLYITLTRHKDGSVSLKLSYADLKVEYLFEKGGYR